MPSLSSVNVRPITADYAAATPTVTFEVSWPDDRNNNQRSKVWLLVDYRRIKDNAYAPGWSRAEITVPAEAITTTAGTVSREDGNTSGFWLQGTESAFTATVTVPVTVDLDGYAPQFGWCGWAIDRPPVAELQENGAYKLYGTSPFWVNGEWLDPGVNTYGPKKCITSFTDATLNPAAVLPMPTNLALSSATVCAGQSATLTASAEGEYLVYTIADDAWEWEDGLWHETTGFVVTPATTTAYTLVVRNAAGCMDTLTGAATVTVNPVPEILAVSSPVICTYTDVTLTATMGSGTTSAMTYTGNLGEYPFTLYTNSFTIGVGITTTYTVTAMNEYGCESALSTGTVTVLPTIQQGKPEDRSVCSGASVVFDLAEATGGRGSFTYQWEQTVESVDWNSTWGPAEGENTGATYTTPPLTQGMYYRRIAMNDECGTYTPGQPTIIFVHPNPEILSLTDSPDAVCAGESATLTASANSGNGNPASYSLNGETWQPEAVFEVTPPASTTYTLYVKNDSGCTASLDNAATVTVNDPIILASGNDSQTIALGDAITQIQYTITNASATATGLPDGVSGAWASDVYMISGTPTSTGTYNYTVTTTNDKGCANTAIGKIIVVPLPPNSIGNTWSCGTQIWSGALRNPAGCTATSTLSSSTPPAQYYDRGTSYGYYYNWTCVNKNATTLCPSQWWRVPTQSDFNTLVSCAKGNNNAAGATLMNAWGATGGISGSTVNNPSNGYLWSSMGNTGLGNANNLFYNENQAYVSSFLLTNGFQVRCVTVVAGKI
jgi:uncharacterized protein (TIGR02145 family)